MVLHGSVEMVQSKPPASMGGVWRHKLLTYCDLHLTRTFPVTPRGHFSTNEHTSRKSVRWRHRLAAKRVLKKVNMQKAEQRAATRRNRCRSATGDMLLYAAGVWRCGQLHVKWSHCGRSLILYFHQNKHQKLTPNVCVSILMMMKRKNIIGRFDACMKRIHEGWSLD